jgi:DNA-binding protein H-NS
MLLAKVHSKSLSFGSGDFLFRSEQAKLKALINEHGLTAQDIFGGAKRGRKAGTRAAVAPKYRDSATGATWTGRGKAPKWIDGKDRTQFAI